MMLRAVMLICITLASAGVIAGEVHSALALARADEAAPIGSVGR